MRGGRLYVVQVLDQSRHGARGRRSPAFPSYSQGRQRGQGGEPQRAARGAWTRNGAAQSCGRVLLACRAPALLGRCSHTRWSRGARRCRRWA